MSLCNYKLHVIVTFYMLICNVTSQRCTDQLDCLRRIADLVEILANQDHYNYDMAQIRLHTQRIAEYGIALGPVENYDKKILQHYTSYEFLPTWVACMTEDCSRVCVTADKREPCLEGDLCVAYYREYRQRDDPPNEIQLWLQRSSFEYDPNIDCCHYGGYWDFVDKECYPCPVCNPIVDPSEAQFQNATESVVKY